MPSTLTEIEQQPVQHQDVFSDIWQQNDNRTTLEMSLSKTITGIYKRYFL